MARRITIFGVGYQGWGRATRAFRKAVDAVERERGFAPPIFVDIRASRSARAKGFSGAAFETLVGRSRYRWMKELGNEQAPLGDRPPIEVSEPSAVSELLDLAVAAQRDGRRLILLSSCSFPKENGRVQCHRHTVERLLIREGRKRGRALQVVEWPGGEPGAVDLRVAGKEMEALSGGRSYATLGKRFRKDLAGLPWGSVATFNDGPRGPLHRVVGPLFAQKDQWALPVLWPQEARDPEKKTCERQGKKLRRKLGLEPFRTG